MYVQRATPASQELYESRVFDSIRLLTCNGAALLLVVVVLVVVAGLWLAFNFLFLTLVTGLIEEALVEPVLDPRPWADWGRRLSDENAAAGMWILIPLLLPSSDDDGSLRGADWCVYVQDHNTTEKNRVSHHDHRARLINVRTHLPVAAAFRFLVN